MKRELSTILLTVVALVLWPTATLSQESFTEEELKQATKKFLEATWDLGQKAKGKILSIPEIEKAIDGYLLAKTPEEEGFEESYRLRRGKAVEFAHWVAQISAKAKDYALKPFIGLKMATKDETPLFKNSVVWRITAVGDDGVAVKFKWIIYLADAARADLNAIGQRILKVVSVTRVADPAPAYAGALFSF